MSIRWKLFIALFFLTAGTVAIVLLVAEREFHSWIRGEVTQRFESRLTGLLESRTKRLAETRESCTELAAHPAITAILKGEGTPELRTAFLEELMKQRPAPGPSSVPGKTPPGRARPTDASPSRPRGPANRPGSRPGTSSPPTPAGLGGSRNLPVAGTIDLEGKVQHLGLATQRARNNRRETGRRLGSLKRQVTQQVAYVTLENPSSQRTKVQEVVLTPVDEDGTIIGWFFLGMNAETQVERSFQQAERATGTDGRYGLIVQDDWFVPDISPEQAAEITAEVSPEFWTSGKAEIVDVNGTHLLILVSDLNPGSPFGKGYQVGIFPLASFISALDHLHVTVAWIGAAAVLITTCVAFLMARRFSSPIAELVAGTERIRQGNLGGSVRIRSKDEFGTLATAFNAMTRDLALKERYREVLAKTSDPAVAQQLVEGELELGGEVRNAAVLFCDIRGFTAMTEGMPPAEVIEFINEHMTALTKLVYLHGGVVDKFVGDLIMAIFGAPNSHPDDALRSARCALEMIDVRQQLSTSTGRVVEIGIGLAYGELVAGCMGSTDRLNYTVLGDRVNLAARLCSAAGAGEIIVDDAIAAALDDSIHAEPRDLVALKGFSSPIPSFAIRPTPENQSSINNP